MLVFQEDGFIWGDHYKNCFLHQKNKSLGSLFKVVTRINAIEPLMGAMTAWIKPLTCMIDPDHEYNKTLQLAPS